MVVQVYFVLLNDPIIDLKSGYAFTVVYLHGCATPSIIKPEWSPYVCLQVVQAAVRVLVIEGTSILRNIRYAPSNVPFAKPTILIRSSFLINEGPENLHR